MLLYANCIVVKGVNRGLIIDTQRNKYFTVPLSLCDMLNEYNGCQVNEIVDSIAETDSDKSVLDEYFDFLNENELIFLSPYNLKNQLPKIQDDFQYPAVVTNAIIEVTKFNFAFIEAGLNQLSKLNCKQLEINFCKTLEYSALLTFLNILEFIEFDCITLFICSPLSSGEITLLGKAVSKAKNIDVCRILNVDPDLSECNAIQPFTGLLQFVSIDYSNIKTCGKVSEQYFNTGFLHYAESLTHNSCLNRKISIDGSGNIKNCPAMSDCFGNIKDTTLLEAINKTGFKKHWEITKDQISKCKDCEFRYICTDCRAFVEIPDDLHSAPLKCGYNPYTNEWEDWSTSPFKQQAIDYYEMREIAQRKEA